MAWIGVRVSNEVLGCGRVSLGICTTGQPSVMLGCVWELNFLQYHAATATDHHNFRPHDTHGSWRDTRPLSKVRPADNKRVPVIIPRFTGSDVAVRHNAIADPGTKYRFSTDGSTGPRVFQPEPDLNRW